MLNVARSQLPLLQCITYACILKAHSRSYSYSMSGGSIWPSLECQCCFLNSWRVSSHIVSYDTNPPTIQKQHWHSREGQIEPPLFECEREWAFRIQALDSIPAHLYVPQCFVVKMLSQYTYSNSDLPNDIKLRTSSAEGWLFVPSVAAMFMSSKKNTFRVFGELITRLLPTDSRRLEPWTFDSMTSCRNCVLIPWAKGNRTYL
jgi:hypothetical protein